MRNPLISIIIPAYNYGHLLKRSITSVINQLSEDIELIIVNDGSTDNTLEVLKNLAKTYPQKFTYYSKKNGGSASARNYGIKKSNGEFLMFLDADDEFVYGSINVLKTYIRENPENEFIVGGNYIISSRGNISYHKPKKMSSSAYERVNSYLIKKTISLSNGSCLMHRNIFKKIRYPEKFRNSEDLPIFAYSLANFNCGIVDTPILVIHKHQDSLRHNLEFTEKVGLSIVDEIFHSKYLSEEFHQLKKQYMTKRTLSLSKKYFNSGNFKLGRKYYRKAFKSDWLIAFNLKLTRKFIQSYLRFSDN